MMSQRNRLSTCNWTGLALLVIVAGPGLAAVAAAQDKEIRLIVRGDDIGHVGYENVAADRAGVTRAFTSDKVKEAVERRGVRLISYAEYHKSRPGTP